MVSDGQRPSPAQSAQLSTRRAAYVKGALKALLAMAYSTMARRGELVALTVERITIDAAGEGIALIYMRKVDREEPRFLGAEVVGHLTAWLDHAKIKSGPVFWRIENTGKVGERSLNPQEVTRILQRVAQRMVDQGIAAGSSECSWSARSACRKAGISRLKCSPATVRNRH
jgi:integrase